METADFYEVLLLAMSDMDTQFQFWLSVTSALVAAIYIAGSKLGWILRTFLTAVYLASCWLIFLRMLINAEILQDIIATHEIEVFTNGLTETSGMFRMIVMIAGTISAAAYAIFHDKVSSKNMQAAPEEQ